eukprot:CAMPEP_0195517906 /NCGR_PEP_ID=MMETSP0794_2-20130614/11815_1 /TAXON_ID=515487 /ORGANISM="Stephanopyxis turris, Strain CCMP 815" /LENGTH=240 /DNA_ID=CAMNT_0040646783 /DNA_START=321 /DNA_END=1043 /DNA_ORIENTATION=+
MRWTNSTPSERTGSTRNDAARGAAQSLTNSLSHDALFLLPSHNEQQAENRAGSSSEEPSNDRSNTNNDYLIAAEFEREEVELLRNELRRMESLFQSLLGQSYEIVGDIHSMSNGYNGSRGATLNGSDAIPPASSKAIRQLPMVKVTKEDLCEHENNAECCICFRENHLGQKVTKLPCGHLYHKPCITEWLKKHCTCPICRYELETDDAFYERGRLERMRQRNATNTNATNTALSPNIAAN